MAHHFHIRAVRANPYVQQHFVNPVGQNTSSAIQKTSRLPTQPHADSCSRAYTACIAADAVRSERNSL